MERMLEALGRAIGGLLAPIAFEASLFRGARVFHPDGVVYRADVMPLATEGALADLARSLEGPAIVRFSGATRRKNGRRDPRDILGAAVRFHADGIAATARAQDLLTATFRTIWQLPFAMLTTNPRDFLGNDYYAVLPFRARGLAGRVKLRLVPRRADLAGADRRERLERAVAAGMATLQLEARVRGERWEPVAEITLREAYPGDPRELAFNPFRAGAGIEPVGFLQAVRAAVYPASQLGRALARRAVQI
jgi:hypothetical protein